jgi:hypothetical protein
MLHVNDKRISGSFKTAEDSEVEKFILWDVMMCSLLKVNQYFRGYVASLYRVKDWKIKPSKIPT